MEVGEAPYPRTRAPDAHNYRMCRAQWTLHMYSSDALRACTWPRQMRNVDLQRTSNNVYGSTGRLGSGKHSAKKRELICVTHILSFIGIDTLHHSLQLSTIHLGVDKST